ncbi:MAG: hypothetical protein NT045_00440, partial [Candidatus Aureabacteria bacterium]|nr:hypothetical protein [Candidatus Auribacterota bacterium]
MNRPLCFSAALFLCIILHAADSPARIEIFLMGQTNGLKPPPLPGDIRFRGTPFGHMALYVESATRDPEMIIRQCREGEPGGLVLTVDRQLKDHFFATTTRREFFYGGLDPAHVPPAVTREDIQRDLGSFDAKYGHLYRAGPNTSGLGQDYGVLYIRNVWGLVYPTTRDEEARIIEHWQRHRHDRFDRMHNNCVTTILGALNNAGIEHRSFFIRGLAPYNTWGYFAKRLVFCSPGTRAHNGNYLRRDGTGVAFYPQLASPAVYRSGRPFNVYSLQNHEYIVWASPGADVRLPSNEPVSYAGYPGGKELSTEQRRHNSPESWLRWIVAQHEEFARLWL